MISANTIPFRKTVLSNEITVNHGLLSVFDPHYIEDSLCPIKNVKQGQWQAEYALFVDDIDGFNLNVKYLATKLAIIAHERNIAQDISNRVAVFVGNVDWYFATFSQAKDKLDECMGNDAEELLSLLDEVVNGFEIRFEDDLDQVKFHTLRGAVSEHRHSWFDVENHKQILAECYKEIHDPDYAKPQFIHLKHTDVLEFTDHESNKWVCSNTMDSSSGKLAIFDSSLMDNPNQDAQTLLNHAEKLCVEYNDQLRRNPVNVRKVGADATGVAMVTPNREHYNEIYTISQEGQIVEILIHFDAQSDADF